jgi:hypothetical protein
MTTAYCVLRRANHYRLDVFEKGLRAAGYDYQYGYSGQPANPGDVLVMWNRYGNWNSMADRFEASGGSVIVAENGYYTPDKRKVIALAIGGHHGSGTVWVPEEKGKAAKRLVDLNIDFKGFRGPRPDGHVLVCGQRGIGSPEMRSPSNWHERVATELRAMTDREVRVRLHPELLRRAGHEPPPLSSDLQGAAHVVVWSSNSAIESLIAGIPTWYCAPHHVLQRAMMGLQGFAETAAWRSRYLAFIEMSWSQWFLDEIGQGIAFEHLKKAATIAKNTTKTN